jgi:hypothetical protein
VTEIKHADSRSGTPSQTSKGEPKQDFVDPLSGGGDPLGADGPLSLAFEGADPLSRFAAEAQPLSTQSRSSSDKVGTENS